MNYAKEIVEQIGQEKQKRLQEGGKDFHGALQIIVRIWSDPSHALIELLQNADDAGATAVEYKMCPQGILFSHSGGHSFREDEVRAICSIADSTKDAEKHTGFMGIGFKAVFQLSNSPFIFSHPWQFRFSKEGFSPEKWGWILIPRWVDSIPVDSIPMEMEKVPKEKTVFWLPYKVELSDDSKMRIAEAIFERFDSICLLFLRNVTKIQIESFDGRFRKMFRSEDTVVEEKNGEETTHKYKVFRKLFNVPDEVKADNRVHESRRDKTKVREIVLAFAIDAKDKLQPMKYSHLYTFLPTVYDPELRFVVQGDFILDSHRSRVEESLKWNQWLWRCVKDLLQSAIEGFQDDEGNHVKGFKDKDNLRYQFYTVLPSKGDFFWFRYSYQTIIRTELVEPFWKYCQETPIIVTSDNTWVKPEEAVIANAEVQKLLDKAKLKELTGREHFVHPEVGGVKEFLKEMGVYDFEEQKILGALKDEHWGNSKERGWFRDLYTFFYDRVIDDNSKIEWLRLYWANELKLPIIKTTQEIAKKPDEVLFPPESEKELELATGIPGVFFVDTSIIEENSHKLLEKLGVDSFTKKGIVETSILKGFEDDTIWQNWTVEERNRCVRFIREWLKEQEWKPPGLQRDLGVVRIETEGNTLERADKCYFPEPELKLIYPEASFVKLNREDEEELNFLRALGVNDRPRLLIEKGEYQSDSEPAFALHWKEFWNWLRGKMSYSTGYQRISDITCLDGWDEIQWSQESAKPMLKYLIKHWESYYKLHLESRYKYFYQVERSEKVSSYLTWQLLGTQWLPTTKGLMKPSAEVFVPSSKIKRVAGDLIPYISIPEGWKEHEPLSQGQEFFEFLGIRTELDIASLQYLLQSIQKRPIDDDLKLHLTHIYQAFGRLLQEENELGEVKLLSESGTFEDPSTLYWNDDHDLGTHFQGSEGVHFAWVPDDVERQYVEVFFEKTGVKAISKQMQRELITPTNVELNEDKTKLLQGKARYIYSLLKHHKADKADKAGEKLSGLKVKSSDKLEILLRLDEIEMTVSSHVFYDVDGNTFYLTKDVENFEIALELSRVFILDLSYISNIEIILREENGRIGERFKRQGIVLLNLPSEKIDDEQGDKTEESKNGLGGSTTNQASPESETESISSGEGGTSQRHYPPSKPDRGVERVVLPYEERMNVEALNIERIIRFEDSQDRKATNVSKENKGYDLESIDEATGEVRYIEVKARSFVMLTPHEYEVAKEKGASYYLYVVDGEVVYIIQDPANSCDVKEIETLETRWNILGWREKAQEYELHRYTS